MVVGKRVCVTDETVISFTIIEFVGVLGILLDPFKCFHMYVYMYLLILTA
jgi:hypothetical protein